MYRGALVLGALALGLSGCAPAPGPAVSTPPPVASTLAEPTVDASTAGPGSPEASPTQIEPVTVTPTQPPTTPPTGQAVPPQEPPPPPTAPAPSTAGGLTEQDVPSADHWQPTAKPGSAEEGFMGNGTWVHATSAEHSAYAAIALGCAEVGSYPQPTAALEGSLTDEAGRPGIGLALEFANATEAEAYFAEWLRQAEACVGTATQKISATGDTWLGRRNLETVWTEAAGVRGSTVRLLIVDSPDADLGTALDGAR